MKKSILLIICFMLLLMSCSTESNNIDKNKSQINVWLYKYSDTGTYDKTAELLIEEMKHYAAENNINLGITSFSSEELAYDDYVLKRNSSIATGKADIIIDCFYKENHGIGLKNITKVLQKYNG